MTATQLLNLIELKKWAKRNLPSESHLRAILTVEKKHMPQNEFIDKIPVWLKLAEIETKYK